MGINIVVIILIISITIISLFLMIRKDGNTITNYDFDEDQFQFDHLIVYIKKQFNSILKTNLYEMNLTKEEFDKRVHNKRQLRKALKSCSYGDVKAKEYVKSFIRDILVNEYGITDTNISKIINFDNSKELSVGIKFDILLYQYKGKYGYQGLKKLIVDNELDQLKETLDGKCYRITADEIEKVYKEKVRKLSKFEDRLEIVVQRIYQQYKGYSVIDEIRDMAIDGVSGGVSGVPSDIYEEINVIESAKMTSKLPASHDSIWIFLQGKTIHLSFLSFGSETELMRVCKNIYKYNKPGQLSQSNGYKVNEMKDGSRIVVARPPFSESWVFFVRKFDSVKKTNVEDLITDQNNYLPIEMIKWLIKGCRVTGVTGNQGTGKTTLLMSIIRYINATFTLRIQEMSFELHLRKIYPYRNIVTFRETEEISGQEGLDLQKKTDGTVHILGEVATAPVASWLVSMSQVASLFTLFTHHAKTTENLILSLRNNLLQTGVFNNEKVAEQQVAEVINFDIHLNKDLSGHRYIERITEIIPLSHYSEYPEEYKKATNGEEREALFMDTVKTFFERMTDRKTFITRDIIRFKNGSYVAVNKPTKRTINEMKKYLEVKEQKELGCFLEREFKLDFGGLCDE